MGLKVIIRVDDGTSSDGRVVHTQTISDTYVSAFSTCETITVPSGCFEIKERGLDLVKQELNLWVAEDGASEFA